MPSELFYDETHNLIYEKVTGIETDETFLASFEEIKRFPHFKPGMKVISDLTGAKIEVSSDAIWKAKDIAIENDSIFSAMIWAVVLPSDLAYGLGTMFETLIQEANMEIQNFRDLESAIRWLELPRGYAPGEIDS